MRFRSNFARRAPLERYDQLAISEPHKQNDVAEWEKMTTGFGVIAETYETCFTLAQKCNVCF